MDDLLAMPPASLCMDTIWQISTDPYEVGLKLQNLLVRGWYITAVHESNYFISLEKLAHWLVTSTTHARKISKRDRRYFGYF